MKTRLGVTAIIAAMTLAIFAGSIGRASAQSEPEAVGGATGTVVENDPHHLPLMTDVEETRKAAPDKILVVLVVPTGQCTPCDAQEERFLRRGAAFDSVKFVKAKISLYQLSRAIVPGVYAYTPGVEDSTYAQPRIDFNDESFDYFVQQRIKYAEKRKQLAHDIDVAQQALKDGQKPFMPELEALAQDMKTELKAEADAVVAAQSAFRNSPPFPQIRQSYKAEVDFAKQEFMDAAEAHGFKARLKAINTRMKTELKAQFDAVEKAQDALDDLVQGEHAAGNQTSI